MSDKEVGELWWQSIRADNHKLCWRDIQRVIRKLVEERAVQYCDLGRSCADYESLHVRHALRDFGIEPEDWKVKHGA